MRAAFAAALALVLFGGCAEKVAPIDAIEGVPQKAPDWIQNPDINGRFSATGGATQSIGGAKFQHIEAKAKASEILRARLEKIALAAAKECLNALKTAKVDDETIEKDAKLASLMTVARASNQFERTHIWWSPARDYYALLRISEERFEATLIDAIAQFVKSNEDYSLNFGMLRGMELIENAARSAIAAAK
ncbi:MAG: hypothetical protein LBO72_06560 [Helicobacteraceae bacterium]|jgi:hypothetical protein|nr:hypothetical protein [Helicobacteraceae bacterium]